MANFLACLATLFGGLKSEQTQTWLARITPDFSKPITSLSVPNHSLWSRSMAVIKVASASTMFTASNRPPRPTSSIVISNEDCEKMYKAAKVENSK